MVPLKVLKSIFKYSSSTGSRSQNAIIQLGGTDGYVTGIVIFIIGVVFILIICIYLLTFRTEKQNRTSATRRFPVFISDGEKRPIKCRKLRKSSSKLRLTKSHKLLEVNRKWSAMYSSENSEGEEAEVTGTFPFGRLSVKRERKVSFRDSLQDVYYIESKEEVKRLEKLNNMGYNVAITRPLCSAHHHSSNITLKNAVCEEKQTVSYPVICSTITDNYIFKRKFDNSKSLEESCQKATELETKDNMLLSNKKSVISNQVLKDEGRFQLTPLLPES